MWAELLPSIAGGGYRPIALDLPGFGNATDPGPDPVAAVLGAMDALHIQRAALVGNSYGGAVALRVALAAPQRVTSMMLVSAPAPALEPSAELEAAWEAEESALERGDIEGALATVVTTWTLPGAPSALRDRIAEMQRRAYDLQAGTGDPAPDDDPLDSDPSLLSGLDTPTLVAVGALDLRDFRESAESLVRELPKARLVEIPDAGHLAPLEAPDTFRGLLLEWLQETEVGEESPDRR